MEKVISMSKPEAELQPASKRMNLSCEEARRREGGVADDGHSEGEGKEIIHDQMSSINFSFLEKCIGRGLLIFD